MQPAVGCWLPRGLAGRGRPVHLRQWLPGCRLQGALPGCPHPRPRPHPLLAPSPPPGAYRSAQARWPGGQRAGRAVPAAPPQTPPPPRGWQQLPPPLLLRPATPAGAGALQLALPPLLPPRLKKVQWGRPCPGAAMRPSERCNPGRGQQATRHPEHQARPAVPLGRTSDRQARAAAPQAWPAGRQARAAAP